MKVARQRADEELEKHLHSNMDRFERKIVDNICGLCDIVGWITVNKDGEHGILLEATQNIYAKNPVDMRKGCKADEFITEG